MPGRYVKLKFLTNTYVRILIFAVSLAKLSTKKFVYCMLGGVFTH
jgi:hypothetical protein